MLRTIPRAMSRVLMATGVASAALSVADCSSFSRADSGTLDGALATPVRPAVSRQQILTWGSGTYIGRLLDDRDSTLDRWLDRVDRPIRVAIETPGGPQGAAFVSSVRAAFHVWQTVGIPVRFQFVDRSEKPEVHVRWVTSLPHKTGTTTWHVGHGGWLQSGDITLATHISNGTPLDTRGVRAIALHEIGHLLGLSHSDDSRDIMSPVVRVDELSDSDVATIKMLYSFPAGG